MSKNWRELLRKITRGRSGAQTEQEPSRDLPQALIEQRETAVNLGIDFGTSFTKVCFRDAGAEQSAVVRLGDGGEALIPSVVCVGSDGRLWMKHRAHRAPQLTEIPFLKMRLADMAIEADDPAIARLSLGSASAGRALSAWFLASVLQESRAYLETAQEARFRNRRIVWTANVGVPVEHCDSPVLAVFREVLAVAWRWQQEERIPTFVTECLAAYDRDRMTADPNASDFHVVPEIAAAIQSFVISRSAVPGFYIYFDIGGGTVDGVAFNFRVMEGTKYVSFYSGKVDALGMAAARKGASLKHRLQCLVGHVIITARKKDRRDWRLAQQGFARSVLGRIDPASVPPLIVFLGGYGARDSWYRKTIKSTYKDFQHHKAGIPPYELDTVPMPSDLELGFGDEFVRFAIAYGLSVPFGEGPEVALPSEVEGRPAPQVRTAVGVDYMDSKDAFD